MIERIGRAMQKHPSIAKFCDIKYTRSTANPKLMSDLSWSTHGEEQAIAEYGAYYLRTNVSTLDEKSIWDYYNLIREIECTNRQLKTDLNLRPIYHQTDERSEAYLFFGLLAYWVVNNIRVQLKEKGIRHYWKEIVRIMSTPKAVTTEATNMLGEKVILRICSDPPPNARKIYQALNYKNPPI
ncbi:transposase [uncultured Porphyromonas sp.]|uniref:transposase n=1 Tax=uncultured Porphyromonas sp. TaxID=159274 RepID=UPI0025999794|nr:transposase [uncultured Porphyromonas sp.]